MDLKYLLGILPAAVIVYFLVLIYKTVKIKGTQEKKEKSNCFHCECGEKDFFEGPGGGSFGNIECVHCGTKYNNLGPFGFEKIK